MFEGTLYMNGRWSPRKSAHAMGAVVNPFYLDNTPTMFTKKLRPVFVSHTFDNISILTIFIIDSDVMCGNRQDGGDS